MCLYVRKKDLPIKTAQQPIVCFKAGGRRKDGRLEAEHFNFQYTKGVETPVVKIVLEVEDEVKEWGTVYEGYHSTIRFLHYDVSPKELFLIPKGAQFLKGGINTWAKEDGYVSDRIIWIGSKWNPLSWLKVLTYYFK